MKFAALTDGDNTVHFPIHDSDLTHHVTVNIRILANCQNAIRGCNVTIQFSIEEELVCKLD